MFEILWLPTEFLSKEFIMKEFKVFEDFLV